MQKKKKKKQREREKKKEKENITLKKSYKRMCKKGEIGSRDLIYNDYFLYFFIMSYELAAIR